MLFIALNSYKRIPRNFFGFKKKKAKPVVMPFTVSMHNEHGAIGNIEIRDAKLKDDPSWSDRRSDRIVYGQPKSEDEVAVWLHEKLSDIQETVLIFDADCESLNNLYEKHWLNSITEEHYGANIQPFYFWLQNKIGQIPTSYLQAGMEDGTYGMTIHLDDQEEFTPEQKAQIFYSHKDYLAFYEKESSVNRAWKMWEVYALVNKVLEAVTTTTV